MTKIEKMNGIIDAALVRVTQLEKDIVTLEKAHEALNSKLIHSHWAFSVLAKKGYIEPGEVEAYGKESIRAFAKEAREKGVVDSGFDKIASGK